MSKCACSCFDLCDILVFLVDQSQLDDGVISFEALFARQHARLELGLPQVSGPKNRVCARPPVASLELREGEKSALPDLDS